MAGNDRRQTHRSAEEMLDGQRLIPRPQVLERHEELLPGLGNAEVLPQLLSAAIVVALSGGDEPRLAHDEGLDDGGGDGEDDEPKCREDQNEEEQVGERRVLAEDGRDDVGVEGEIHFSLVRSVSSLLVWYLCVFGCNE